MKIVLFEVFDSFTGTGQAISIDDERERRALLRAVNLEAGNRDALSEVRDQLEFLCGLLEDSCSKYPKAAADLSPVAKKLDHALDKLTEPTLDELRTLDDLARMLGEVR